MVTVRLTMLCATATPGSPGRVFGDGLPGEDGRSGATAALPPYARALRAPSVRCARIAEALAVEAAPEDALRDLDYGAWEGRLLQDIAAEDPHGLSTWLRDPRAAPHGGESVARLCARTAAWLTALPAGPGRVLAITEAPVVRAALVHALAVPARAFWQLRVPPLSTVTLTLSEGHWTARLGRPAAPRRPSTAEEAVPVAALTLRPGRERLCLAARS
ncbi:histidine phosphatase family protein [Streptomyces sp. SCL15-4]|uniref:histidine phosphatase family protein n=1 Tax=Streptomyces sp. SCL15-4 TaxID=2967221 RepID=UPI002966EC71|nr:histidine phosphatase family protein [Streptomyces sp. SCL15-4]